MVSTLATTDALAKVLIKKGIINEQELPEMSEGEGHAGQLAGPERVSGPSRRTNR